MGWFKDLGEKITEAATLPFTASFKIADEAGLSSVADKYTGGAISSYENALKLPENLIAGRSVKSNLFDAARTGATVAAVVGTGGAAAPVLAAGAGFGTSKVFEKLKSGDTSGLASLVGSYFGSPELGALGDTLIGKKESSIGGDIGTVVESGEYITANPYNENMIQGSSSDNLKKYLIIGGAGLIAIMLLMKGKK